MKHYPRVVPHLIVFWLFASAAAWSAARIQDDIGASIAQPDGTQVTLPGEQVLWRGTSGKSFAIKEWTEPRTEKPRLVVVSRGELPVGEFWSVDVTGTLGTYSDRDGGVQRVLVVSPADVLVYCSPNGKPCPFIPVKQSGVEWENKTSLVELAAAGYAACSRSAFQDGELPPLPDTPEYEPLPPAPGSRDSIKLLPDGAEVALNGVVVSTSIENSGYFYAERSDRSFGICVVSPTYVYNGQLVDITGYMATWEGERCIVADVVESPNYLNAFYPRARELFVPNRSLIGPEPGANTTGLLVRTSGRVIYRDIPLWIIDDGSAPLCGWWEDYSEIYGVFVMDPKEVCQYWPSYDPGHTYPDVGDYVTVTGSSGAMLLYDPYTYEPLWTIPIIFADDPVDGPVALTRGTCSGTVSGSVPDGATARVYSGPFSTTATFDDGAAAFQGLSLPTGDNSVTVSLVGYKSVTDLVTITQGQNTSVSFQLEPLPKYIDLVSNPARIEPASTDTITVTAIVRDREGRRLSDEPVTWNTDIPSGRIVSVETSTDVVGEARMIVQPSATASTATVTATSGQLTGRCFPEFATPDAPRIWVLSPERGDSVGGDVDLEIGHSDWAGEHPGIVMISLFADGELITEGPATFYDASWPSFRAANGNHQIWATARDGDGNISTSNIVTVTAQNSVSELSTSAEEVAQNQPVHIAASLSSATDWRVSVKDVDDLEVWYTTGNGATISVNWPGTDQNGLYLAEVTTNPGTQSSESQSWPVVINPQDATEALLVCEEYTWSDWRRAGRRVCSTLRNHGITYTYLMPEEAYWLRIKAILQNPYCKYLYVNSHGQYLTPSLPCPVTHLLLTESNVILYAWRADGMPPSGDPDPWYTGWTVAYATELDRYQQSTMKFAFINACFSGQIGAYRGEEDDPYYGKYGMFSCYEINGLNDMAGVLGITGDYTAACGYVGWYTEGCVQDKGLGGSGLLGLLPATWATLASGCDFEFTRDWIADYHSYTRSPCPDKYNPIRGFMEIAPFYNWRFWGTPDLPLF